MRERLTPEAASDDAEPRSAEQETPRTAVRVEANGVGHRFGMTMLFESFSHTFLPGRSYSLTGPSGSGKSTLLALLSKTLAPTVGTIDHVGVDHIGWVFQNPFGAPRRTVIDHVVLALLAQGSTRAEAEPAARRLLERFGLVSRETAVFAELSGGEAQRLMLVRALAARPNLLLVDEPTAQLDPRTAATVDLALAETKDDGCIVIVATHDERTAEACDERIALIA